MTDIMALCSRLPLQDFAAGEALLTEGDPGGVLFILKEGSVVVTKNGAEVAQVTEPGAVFGEMSVLLELPISATVTAVSPVKAHYCTDPFDFFAGNPDFSLHTARLLASRLHNATTYLADLKLQFEDRSDHFGIMDQILGAMVEQQPKARPRQRRSDDPRL
ncbi:cyclic nucleotide-binding domain-containing protein [Rhodobacterales bacterium HKCCSP123]|nr:cyclic nucleotide-binding domain-containing protein [Rhodobacterales bacterium HKCCSP123]